MTTFTLDDLRKSIQECAGQDESVDLSGDIGDTTFSELGYDSLAVMETASRVSRDYDVELPEEEVGELKTPRDFVDFVNARLQVKA
jgi:minimal PKS acyl carrier protein